MIDYRQGDVTTTTLDDKAHVIFTDMPYNMNDKGFMGSEWDTGIAFKPETWEHLKGQVLDGGFVVAFCGSQTMHKAKIAAEKAGLVIHQDMFFWLNGVGQPHGVELSKAADRELGNNRQVIATKRQRGAKYRLTADEIDNGGYNDPTRTEYAITAPGSETTAKMKDYYYGRYALAPRVEPVMIAQKPWAGRSIEGVLTHGTGCYNIGDSRLDNGNYPGTFHLSHAPDCTNADGVWQCVEMCTVNELESNQPGASGKFAHVDWSFEVMERYLTQSPVWYNNKVGYWEREAGMDGYPCSVCGKTETAYHTINGTQQTCRRNNHRTLKPIKMLYRIARMFLPPETVEDRHVYIPFAGAGSEVIASMFAGWDKVTGIELSSGHVEIGLKRIDYWRSAYQSGFDVDGVLEKAYEAHIREQARSEQKAFSFA